MSVGERVEFHKLSKEAQLLHILDENITALNPSQGKSFNREQKQTTKKNQSAEKEKCEV